MNKNSFFFEYIYYRLNSFYFKWDGRNGFTSIIGVSMIQSILLGDVILLILKVFLTDYEISLYSKSLSYGVIFIFLIICFVNSYKYKNRFNEFKTFWKNETAIQRRYKGGLVVFSLIMPWILLVLTSLL